MRVWPWASWVTAYTTNGYAISYIPPYAGCPAVPLSVSTPRSRSPVPETGRRLKRGPSAAPMASTTKRCYYEVSMPGTTEERRPPPATHTCVTHSKSPCTHSWIHPIDSSRCWASSEVPRMARSRPPTARWRWYLRGASISPCTHHLDRQHGTHTPSQHARRFFSILHQQWHPDKNLGNPEATAVFQLIQEANAVLSDPRERSWYDSHRDEILRGGDGQGGEEGDGEGYVVNVWPFFNGGAFSGYTDAPGGFYAVYRGVFEVGVYMCVWNG